MPLVKIFGLTGGKSIPLVPLQKAICDIFNNTPAQTKVIKTRVDGWTEEFAEDCYVSIRAKAIPARDRETIYNHMKEVQAAFKKHDLIANIRLETYQDESFFHVPPPSFKVDPNKKPLPPRSKDGFAYNHEDREC